MGLRTPNEGDPVVYSKSKQSVSPGPRARHVNPAGKGDSYSYVVEKHWSIKEVHADGTVTLVTRRGKTHVVRTEDPCLRPANLWERLIYAARFPGATEPSGDP